MREKGSAVFLGYDQAALDAAYDLPGGRASDISSPPCLPRLRRAGAIAGWAVIKPTSRRRSTSSPANNGPPVANDIGKEMLDEHFRKDQAESHRQHDEDGR